MINEGVKLKLVLTVHTTLNWEKQKVCSHGENRTGRVQHADIRDHMCKLQQDPTALGKVSVAATFLGARE